MRLFHIGVAVVLLATVPYVPLAQPAPPAQPAQFQRRAPAATMTLTTTAWTDGGAIPTRYSQKGRDVSPPLSWAGAPADTVSFVLIVHDIDQPIGSGTDDMLHWLVWNIPKDTTGIAERVPQGAQWPNGARQISGTGPYYRGPAAPASGQPHHYVFEIFAVDTTVNVPAVGQSPAETRAAVLSAMAGHVRARGALVGTYKR